MGAAPNSPLVFFFVPFVCFVDSKKRRAIIIANGELRDPAQIKALLRPDDVLIAADGGTRRARALGWVPHIVVGDLDSLPPEERLALERAGARFEVHPARKDETDLELALRVAFRENTQQIIIAAALGTRWDQSLANVLLLAHPDFSGLPIRIVDGADTLTVVRGRATISGTPGDTVSLLPLAGDAEGVTLSGLEYPLTDATLRFGHTTGVSNVLVGREATVSARHGLLLVIHTRQT